MRVCARIQPEGTHHHLLKKSFSLSANPGTNGAPNCEVTICALEGTESPQTLLNWLDSWAEITVGLDTSTNCASQECILLNLPCGTPQTLFREAEQICMQITCDSDVQVATNADYTADNTVVAKVVIIHHRR